MISPQREILNRILQSYINTDVTIKSEPHETIGGILYSNISYRAKTNDEVAIREIHELSLVNAVCIQIECPSSGVVLIGISKLPADWGIGADSYFHDVNNAVTEINKLLGI